MRTSSMRSPTKVEVHSWSEGCPPEEDVPAAAAFTLQQQIQLNLEQLGLATRTNKNDPDFINEKMTAARAFLPAAGHRIRMQTSHFYQTDEPCTTVSTYSLSVPSWASERGKTA